MVFPEDVIVSCLMAVGLLVESLQPKQNDLILSFTVWIQRTLSSTISAFSSHFICNCKLPSRMSGIAISIHKSNIHPFFEILVVD